MSNKQFMTSSEADIFMSENPQFNFIFTSTKTELGEEPSYLYIDSGVKYLVIRDEIDHPSIYAFALWSDGEKFFTSPLFEGQKALDCISQNQIIGWDGTIKTFNDFNDAIAEYKKY